MGSRTLWYWWHGWIRIQILWAGIVLALINFSYSAKYESVGGQHIFSSLDRDPRMPAVQTMDCLASTDCDQIFIELVEKQAQDFGVVDNRTLLFKQSSSQNGTYTRPNLRSVLHRSRISIPLVVYLSDSGNFANAYYGQTCRDLSFRHIEVHFIMRKIWFRSLIFLVLCQIFYF
jgi:hypothetical protein